MGVQISKPLPRALPLRSPSTTASHNRHRPLSAALPKSALLSWFLRNNHLWECRFVTASSAPLPLSASVAASHPPHPSQTPVTFLHSYLLFLRNNTLLECRFVTASSAPLPLSASVAASHPPHPSQTPVTFLHSYLLFLRNHTLLECRFVTASSAPLPLSASVAASHPPHPSQTPVTFLHSYLLFLRNNTLMGVQAHPLSAPFEICTPIFCFLETTTYGVQISKPSQRAPLTFDQRFSPRHTPSPPPSKSALLSSVS